MRRPAALLAAAFALALAVALWLFLSSNRDDGAAERPGEEAAAPEDVGSVEAPLERPGSEEPEREGAPPAEGPDSTSAQVTERPDGARDVLIVRARTFEPLAEVEVLWWPRAVRGEEQVNPSWRWAQNSGEDKDLPPGFHVVRSDAQGVAWLPDAPTGVRVIARAPGWLGLASFEPGETPPMVVECWRDFAASVRVVGRNGEPIAGASVSIREDEGTWSNAAVRARTGADGLARFPHFGASYAAFVPELQSAWVALEELGEPRVKREVALEVLQREPVTLELAPGGECEVKIVDEDGSVPTGAFDIYLGVVPSDDANLDELHPFWIDSVKRAGVEGGSAVFHHVVLGKRLVANVAREGTFAFQRAAEFGPRTASERATIEVRLGQRGATLAGRALGADGLPLAGALVQVRLGGSEDEQRFQLGPARRADSEGRFRCEIDTGEWLRERPFQVQLVQLGEDGADLASAERPLPLLVAGTNELGDFRLGELPTFATGRVVDGAGEPVGGARVTASVRAVEPGGTEEYVQELDHVFALTDALGRFTLRSATRQRELELTARKAHLASRSIRASLGTRDLQIELVAGGEIAGRLQVDPQLPATRFYVFAAPEIAGDPDGETQPMRPDADGRFLLRGLKPGSYRVFVRDDQGWNEVASVPGVLVVAGERTRDARLDPIDLSGRMRTATLSILEVDGTPYQGEVYALLTRRDPDGERTEYVQVKQGKASVLYEREPPSVSITAPGRQGVFIEHLDGDRSVTLEEAPKLTFVLAPPAQVPAPPVFVSVEIRPTGKQEGMITWLSNSTEFSPAGVAQVDGIYGGRVRVVVSVSYRTEERWTATEVWSGAERFIDVMPRADQRIEIQLAPEALAQAIENVSKP